MRLQHLMALGVCEAGRKAAHVTCILRVGSIADAVCSVRSGGVVERFL